jgi:hypothetical protein
MTKKAIMVDGGTIDHKPFSSVSGGVFVINNGQTNSALSIEGNDVYVGPLTYSFSGGDATGFVNGSVYTKTDQDIDPGTPAIHVDGDPVMRVDDESSMVCYGVPTVTPPAESIVPFATVIVATAGQNKMESD